MSASASSYQACERIVAQAIYGIKGRRIGILDEDDLKQELILVAMKGASRADGRPGNGYVRTCVRNAIVQLYAHVSAAKRHPQDRFGRPVWFANPDIIEISADEATPDPEALAVARERVDWLISRLPPAEAALVERAARGEIELTSQEADRIRYTKKGGRMSDQYAIPDGEVESCHVRGGEPEGYDSEESICHSCVDKFSCLPEAVATPDVWTGRGAKVWRVDDDHEVAALLAKEMTFKEVLDRVVRRTQLNDAGVLIPAELLVRSVADVVDPEPQAGAESPAESGPAVDPAHPAETPVQEATVATKKKAAKRTLKKKAPVKVTKKRVTKKKVPVRPRQPTVAKGTKTSGHKTPRPCPITEEKMVKMLGNVRLGKAVELEWGAQIVRRVRSGVEHVVTITKSGFLYGDKHYSSLSAAAQVASGQFRSGNDWFGLHHRGAQVRSVKGKTIASRTVGS